MASRRESGKTGPVFKMALDRAAWSAGEATAAAMIAAAGCSGPHSLFLEARSFTPKKRQSGSLPPMVGFYFI